MTVDLGLARISSDGLYRYHLSRQWDRRYPRMVFIMLNPSTADGKRDNPTIRRCIGFAKREGCGGLEFINLYALRATKPVHLLDHPDPEGPDNPLAWAQTLLDPDQEPLVVAAWGAFNHPDLPKSKALTGCSSKLHVLGTTKDGAPRHPLCVRANQPLESW